MQIKSRRGHAIAHDEWGNNHSSEILYDSVEYSISEVTSFCQNVCFYDPLRHATFSATRLDSLIAGPTVHPITDWKCMTRLV